jgi:hypothetical protein
VFARANTEAAILEAIREHRTVVYDRARAYGDPELIRLARQEPRLEHAALIEPDSSFLALFSRVIGVLGLLGTLCFGFGQPSSIRGEGHRPQSIGDR